MGIFSFNKGEQEGAPDDNNGANSGDSGVTGDDLLLDAANTIMAEAPDVQQHAVDEHESQQQTADADAETDSAGTPFDGRRHTGSKLKDGTWRLKRNPSAEGSRVATSRKSKAAEVATIEPDNEAKAIASGKAAAHLIFMLGQTLGGPEWKPEQPEIEFQEGAWIGYARASNMQDIPPGLILCIALASYAGPRFTQPETRARVGKVRHWVSLRVARWKIKKELKKRGIEATVTIKGSNTKNALDEILINGKPASELGL